MYVSCNLWNHTAVGQRSIEDIIGILGQMCVALGHQVIWEPAHSNEVSPTFIYGPGRYNLIVEGFKPHHIETLVKARAGGCRFIMLATEEPTPTGFNHGVTKASRGKPGMLAMQQEMVLRQEVFPQAAAHCEGILHLVPGEHVTRWYSQFAPSAQAELGYAPTLLRIRPQPVPDFDFGFYGSLSPRRIKVLERLAKAVNKPLAQAVNVVADFATQEKRDHEMRRCKVIVQIRKTEEMGLVSSSRCNTALMIGRPVVAEPHELSRPWDQVIRFPATMDEFFSQALLAKVAWSSLHRDQLEKFKKAFPPEYCIGEPLRKIGILGQKADRAAEAQSALAG